MIFFSSHEVTNLFISDKSKARLNKPAKYNVIIKTVVEKKYTRFNDENGAINMSNILSKQKLYKEMYFNNFK